MYQLLPRSRDALWTTNHGKGTSWKTRKSLNIGRRSRLLWRLVMKLLGAWPHQLSVPRDVPTISSNIAPPGLDSQICPHPSLVRFSKPGAFSGGPSLITLGRTPLQFLASDVPLSNGERLAWQRSLSPFGIYHVSYTRTVEVEFVGAASLLRQYP